LVVSDEDHTIFGHTISHHTIWSYDFSSYICILQY